jgi:glycosyltransferase involved in cell wall biosynthesis
MQEKVSVIIPTYNRSKLLERAIQSVLSQNHKNLELLIVDDGSTDDTAKICKNYVNKDERIKYFYQNNSGGPATPRNVGIEKSTGSFIAFLDSDDEWLPNKLERQLFLFKKTNFKNLGFVGCNVNIIESLDKNINKEFKIKYNGNIFKKLLDGNFILSCTNVLIKKDVLLNVGKFDTDLKYLDDFDMWLRISKAGYMFDFVEYSLFNYYIHNTNITKDFTRLEILLEEEKIFNKYSEFKDNPKKLLSMGLFFLRLGETIKAESYFNKARRLKTSGIAIQCVYILSTTGYLGNTLLLHFYKLYTYIKKYYA